MNRYSRYTYKAKRKDNGEWVYGNVIINPNSTDKVVIVESGVTSYSSTKEAILEFINDYVEIIPETLCQCTGLQDKEGNYIFENDIVSGYGNIFKATVEWNTSFCGFYPFCNEETKIFADECKILGNKFDKEVE